MLTTGLDNLLGTNGNDVVLATFDGVRSTLELDDSFNALLGQDTLRLDVLEDATFDSADYHMVGFERVLVQARADDVDVNLDLADMAGVDLEVRNMVDGDGDLTAENIDGDVLVVNFDGDDIDLTTVGGDVVWNSVDVDYVNIDSVAGSVTLTDVRVSGELNIGDGTDGAITGDTVSLTNVDILAGIDVDIVFASSVTSATVNLADFSQDGYDFVSDDYNSDSYFDIEGAELTNLVINVNADSDMNELHLHDNPELTSVVINLNADLVIDELMGVTDSDENQVANTLTINGAGNLAINSISDDDFMDIIYTGSGSLQIGAENRALGDEEDASDYVPNVGSFNASTATGDVTLFLDLDDFTNDELDSLDFAYIGSQGSDRVVIADAESLNNAATDVDLIALSIEGGTGTDTLVVLDSDDLSTAALSKVSGFETVELTGFGEGEVFSLTNAGEFTSVVLSHAVDANYNEDITVSGLSAVQAQNITIVQEGATVDYDGSYDVSDDNEGDLFDDLTLSLATSTGTSDVVSLTFVQDTNQLTDGVTIDDTLTIDAVETINLTSVGGSYTGLAADFLDWDGAPAEYIEYGTLTQIYDFDADALRTLNISGTGSLDVSNINAEVLTVIDARGFTGPYLGLGTNYYEGSVNTDLDLVVHGSATADHNIDINGNETVTITTGSGDDDININADQQIAVTAGAGTNYISVDSAYEGVTVTTGSGVDNIDAYAEDDIIITAGAGINNIYADSNVGDVTITTLGGDDEIDVNDAEDVIINAGDGDNNIDVGIDGGEITEDVTVTTGTGEDDINIYDGEDVTVISGADEDEIFIDTDVRGAVIIDAGSQNDRVTIEIDGDDSETVESFRITLGAGVDTLTVNASNAGANAHSFTVTDFAAGTGGDVLNLVNHRGDTDVAAVGTYATADTRDGDYDFSGPVDADEAGYLEFAFEANNNGETSLTAATLLAALGDDSAAVITVDDNQEGYIVAYNGGKAYIFNFEDTFEEAATVSVTLGIGQDTYNDNQADAGDNVDDFTITLDANNEGFDEGDTIVLSNIFGSGSLTYTVEEDNMDIAQIAAEIIQAINSNLSSQWNSDGWDYVNGNVVIYVESDTLGNESDVAVTYNNIADTATLSTGEISLVGVLNNVTVGSLTSANFDLTAG